MKKVLLLLSEGFEIYEASVFIDVIGWNLIEGDGSTKLYSCGLKREIQSAFSQKFIVDYLVNEIDIDSFDALAIPGGFEVFGFYTDAYDEKFLNVIRRFQSRNKPIASVCVGALPIAKSGILQNKKATTYDNPIRRQVLKDCGANLVNEPMVISDNIITSWNPLTAMEVAFTLLETLTTKKNADHVRTLMGFK